ncbi:MAG TPA: BON domain-containing protein [Candidatus Sericytochromatia bacterium]|jgi:hypothetical protein
MQKSIALLFSSILALSVVACDNAAKTSSEAPDSAATSPTNIDVDKPAAQTNQNDATGEIRRKQLNADIRAREQRNKAIGDESVRADGDLKSEVRSKLEANLPASTLAVDAKEGAVTITGKVVDEKQLQKVEPLAKQIKGVKSVNVTATVNTAIKPEPAKPGTSNPIKTQTNAQ